jgi:hypothetical protein
MTLKMKTAAAVLMGASLVGCASGSANPSRYSTEFDRLEADCKAREGILAPTGSQSGQPARDYACKITGGASRLN